MTQDSWASVEAVDRAARACAQRKRSRPDAIAFRARSGEEVLALARRLERGDYTPQPGIVFVTERPKLREVHAAPFRDRVVHHLLHALLEPFFEKRFIADSFACRRGKGTHASAARLREHMRRVTREGHVRAFALQLDVKSFFPSVHKPTLLALLDRARGHVPDAALALAKRIVEHDAAAVARRRGDLALFARVPQHKRLGASGPDRGLPIGNLTSQFFANVYLDALDQFVKRTLGARYYVRYVDDFVLLHHQHDVLTAWEARIRGFLAERLRLELHAPKLAAVSEGVDFVGFVVRPGYVLPRRRVVRALEQKLTESGAALAPITVPLGERRRIAGVGPIAGPCLVQALDAAAIERLRATWASYEGHLGHADARRLRARLVEKHAVLGRMLRLRARGWTRRFSLPRPEPSLASQVARLRVGLEGAVLLLRVGCFAEVAGERDARALGLRLRRRRRGGRRFPGVPWRMVSGLVRRALKMGLRVAVAVEAPIESAGGNVKARRLAYLFAPLAAAPAPAFGVGLASKDRGAP
jgi:hypothetical protein